MRRRMAGVEMVIVDAICLINYYQNRCVLSTLLKDEPVINSAGLIVTDGDYKGVRHFSCMPNRGVFVDVSSLRSDNRFSTPVVNTFGKLTIVLVPSFFVEPQSFKDYKLESNSFHDADFGPYDSGEVKSYIGPCEDIDAVAMFSGPNKGIQGHRNSCYLDVTLYSMFAHTSVFDQ